MSNFLAVATVTATLRDLLQGAVADAVPGATATAVRPDGADNGLPSPGVNIYLYQVTPNSAWRNEDLPTRSGDGRLLQRPRVALDLHYLLTFYDGASELESQRVLGSVSRTLHAQAILTRERIQATVTAALAADPNHFLGNADLQDEIERVKFMPLALSLEELSKLWSVFFQTPYTLSMAYLASAVLIEAEQAPQRALPVRVRQLSVVPFQQAVIESVTSAAGEEQPVLMNATLLIRGRRLASSVEAVRIGETELSPAAVSDTEISMALTDSALRAGVQGVQVLYVNGAESNVMPLVLHPMITRDADDNHEIDVTDVVVDPEDATRSATITVQLAPVVGRRQRATLYLNERPPAAARAYGFPAASRSSDSGTLHFAIRGVAAGAYLLRVQVAGAESLLDVDPVSGVYQAPQVTIP